MNMTPAKLLASIKNQARRAVYDERDDSAHFEQFHWVKDEAIRRRILVERAIVRRAVRDILAADDGAYCMSVNDGEEYPVKRSRDLDKIMANIGQCDEETIIVRHFNQDGTPGDKLGCIYLVYGNDGWDVIADHTDSPLMHELLQEANRLANVLGALIAATATRAAAAAQATMTPSDQSAGAGTPPGELLRRFREYLTVHPGIELGGHDMDNMALDLTRIALTALEPIEAATQEG